MVEKITYNKPSDAEKWNALCRAQGNLLQSTYYDRVYDYYRTTPIYFEYYENNELVAGVRFYEWKASRLKWVLEPISKKHIQLGEFVFLGNYPIEKIKSKIDISINSFIKKQGVVLLSCSNFYGGTNLLFIPEGNVGNTSFFQIAYLELNRSENELLAEMHQKHRNSLNKAIKSNLIFEETHNVDILVELIGNTYEGQNKNAPNMEYIRNLCKVAKEKNFGKIYVVKNESEILAAAFVQFYGSVADYSFGGNKKNNFGAGQFLQWNIIRTLKKSGINKYYLGQVAKEIDNENLKFSEGISKFKMRFGCKTLEATSTNYVLKPLLNKMFILTKRISGNES